MEFFRPKAIIPIDKETFRRHIFISFFYQALFVALIFLIDIKEIFPDNMFLSFGTIILINLVFITVFFNFTNFKGRLKDIYPNYKLPLSFIILVTVFPFIFVSMIIFLCFKDKSERPEPPVYLTRYRYVGLILFSLLTLQSFSPLFSYWTSNPTTFYIIDTVHDVFTIMKYKKTDITRKQIMVDYQRKYAAKKLSSTEITMLLALTAQEIAKEKGRNVASLEATERDALKYGLIFLNDFHQFVIISESTKLGFADYSPAQWLYPSGTTEILLLSLVEAQVLSTFNQNLVHRMMSAIESLEAKVKLLPELERVQYEKELANIKLEYKKTKTYRSIASKN